MDRLEQIFNRQRAHIDEFHRIQEENGLLFSEVPANPDLIRESLQLHLTLHWANLELAEAILATSFEQRKEELADALHFIVEFCIMAGFNYTIVPEPKSPERDRLSAVISENNLYPSTSPPSSLTTHISISAAIIAALRVADHLKNKPWKQTAKPIGREALRTLTLQLLAQFGTAVSDCGLTSHDIFAAYFAKSQTNFKRAETGV